MREEFTRAITANKREFDIQVSDDTISRLADYYEIVLRENPILHLVAPCSPEEFATRHILESLTLLKHLPADARFADVGPGAGLPSIPCLIARDDLTAFLIESKEKKTAFLEATVKRLGLDDRVEMIARQFSETVLPAGVTHVACRAIDKFEQKLPALVKWSRGRGLLLFGGRSLADALIGQRRRFHEVLMPLSERRYLFVVDKRPPR